MCGSKRARLHSQSTKNASLRFAKTAGERREVEANSLDSIVRRRCGLEREVWTDKETLQEGQRMLSDRWTYLPILNRYGSENYSVRDYNLPSLHKDCQMNDRPKRSRRRQSLCQLSGLICIPTNPPCGPHHGLLRHDRVRRSSNVEGANDHKKTRHEGDGHNIPGGHALQTQSKLRF